MQSNRHFGDVKHSKKNDNELKEGQAIQAGNQTKKLQKEWQQKY